MRSRRLFLLGMALILLFVLVPNLWGRAERLLYPRKYEALVEQWADTYDLDPLLVDAFIRTESGFDPQATSTVDARGLMQMTEETFIWLRSKIAPDEGPALCKSLRPGDQHPVRMLLPAPVHGALQRRCCHCRCRLSQRVGHGGCSFADGRALRRRRNPAGLSL